jgi:hypothetical protein
MNENVEIVLYVPIGDQEFPEQDLKWLSNFSKILQVGLTQFYQIKIKITDPVFSKDEVKKILKRDPILIQLLINESIDNNNVIQNFAEEDKINKDQIIQLNCYPVNRNNPFANNFKTFNFFDEISNKSIKLDENIEKIKDDVWLKFLDLSLEIKRRVRDLSKNQAKETISKSVFLSYTSSDQNINRLIIEREIRQLGYKIFDPSKAINDAAELKKEIEESLAKSTLSLHIIGNSELPLVPGQEISVVEYQNKVFVEYMNNNKNASIFRLIWIPPDIKPKTEKQKLFIDSFMHQVEAMGNTEIVQTPIEVFKSIIQRKLISKPAMDTIEKKSENGDKKSIYLIYNESDIEKVKLIKSEFEKKNLAVLMSEKAQNNIESIRNHHKNLIQCDAVLIVQTESNKLWLNSKISDILKAPGIGRKKKYAAKALYTLNNSIGIITGLKDLLILNSKVSISESIQPIIEILEKYDTSR